MNDRHAHLALREWRDHVLAPTRVASFLGASAILTLVGPFETDEVMRTLPRFGYWAVLVVVCYSVGYWGNALSDRVYGPRGPLLKRFAIAAPITGIGVLAVVCLLNGLAIGFWPAGRQLALLSVNIIVISFIITVIFQIANQQDAEADLGAPPLLDRLPFDKRGPLVALTVQDHYVRIRTTKGEDMVLMRLGDAIRETGTTPGLQTHRSHWAALDQVTAANRKGDGAVLSMAHGPDIPVSRANVAKIREAGLLPRS